MIKHITFNFLVLSLFLISMFTIACNSTKNTGIQATNYELESEKGWTWIKRPPLEEGGKDYTIVFEMGGQYSISLDVNTCFGEYNKGDDRALVWSEYPACTEACCDKEIANQFIGTLYKTQSFAIQGDTLLLKGEDESLYFLPSQNTTGE